MKKALFIIVALLVMFGISALTFVLYTNHDEALDFDDLELRSKQVSEGNRFSAEFRCKLDGKVISDYEYYMEDNTLYLTLFANAAGKTDFMFNLEGYTKIILVADTDIEKVVYVCGDNEDNVSFTKK